jgi:hypothetical protein
MRLNFDPRKSLRLRANPLRGIGFEEAGELFSKPYWLDQRSDVPEQCLSAGWAIVCILSSLKSGPTKRAKFGSPTKEEMRTYEENS